MRPGQNDKQDEKPSGKTFTPAIVALICSPNSGHSASSDEASSIEIGGHPNRRLLADLRRMDYLVAVIRGYVLAALVVAACTATPTVEYNKIAKPDELKGDEIDSF